MIVVCSNGSHPSHLAGLDNTRTLQHVDEYVVKAIYDFFRSFTGLPQEIFPNWYLTHAKSLTVKRILPKTCELAGDDKFPNENGEAFSA